jgi:CHRD domain
MTPAHTILTSVAASAALIATAALAGPATGGAKLSTVMTGAAEVPGPGDPDGRGTAKIIVNPGKAQICWELNVRDIETATAAHIHSAPAGIAGPVVLGLSAPVTNNNSTGCETVARSLADAIRKSPQAFYVNVHNATYPAGAIRGQLG